ncbi:MULTISPECIES: OsmC family protein [Thermoactinomyces]|jgi:putative redox protein|uniref:OsmC family protein n=1 Tax=Thermoactinomyces daqus TaxID=1329516 RepID=A0A7W1X952_9BACL|nr:MULTISPECIES: OsmC family protein [Thermoactinomyces]MBA4542314.1 OsmC family protein [Thermoactinomyces daqus]MBH8598899.1 OsmC family protein [Thermoactinomyces sp. CICC 10523]MBH8604884.1 OsmC family protein [Thermoactinomyces sp. CICC 10522]MBH8607290.1 OsmC family protein [Thermoactinomyces sp. CICC 10521]
MKVDIVWKGKMHFETTTGSGHQLSLDASPEVGGENLGPRPTEILLSAVGTCSGIDIVDILRKMRLEVASFSMEVSGERAEEHPRRFTHVHMHYKLTGDLPEEKVRRAVKLSVEKYCSVSNSLSSKVTTSFEINGERYEV